MHAGLRECSGIEQINSSKKKPPKAHAQYSCPDKSVPRKKKNPTKQNVQKIIRDLRK